MKYYSLITFGKKEDYDNAAKALAIKFHKDSKGFTEVYEEIKQAGPIYKGDSNG